MVQAGLAALKVPQSLEEGTNKEDPLHLDDFRLLAAGEDAFPEVHCSVDPTISSLRKSVIFMLAAA